MGAYVYDLERDEEYYAGSVQGDYSNRKRVLSDCQVLAYDFAEEKGFDKSEWSYICCTETKKSSCVTKIR